MNAIGEQRNQENLEFQMRTMKIMAENQKNYENSKTTRESTKK